MINLELDEVFHCLADADAKENGGNVRVSSAYQAMAFAVILLVREKEVQALEGKNDGR